MSLSGTGADEVTLDHGLSNTMAGDYSSVAYWYQSEPHEPFDLLPSAAERRPAVPWTNPLQWLILVGSLALFFAGFVYLLVR